MEDPFAVLGLREGASLDDVRAARRRLAKEHHPDHGGDPAAMRRLNAAFDAAVKAIRRPATSTAVPASTPSAPPAPASPRRPAPPASPTPGFRPFRRGTVEHDAPSFTIDVLPAEAFEALLVVTAWHGEVLVDDPPYLLEVHLHDPAPCWCRLDLVPDAGGTTVSLTVAGEAGEVPTADEVRDLWVASLNALGRDDP